MDEWNPETFSDEVSELLKLNADLIADYHQEDKRLMDEHLTSNPYQSLQPNRYGMEYSRFVEHALTPILATARMRVWHYSRLTDYEVELMTNKLQLSTLEGLKERLDDLGAHGLITADEAKTIFDSSPFQSQSDKRSNRFYAVTRPLPASYHGVKPLLEKWGGESAYFRLSESVVAEKLTRIGISRIIEVETGISDSLNAFQVSQAAAKSWAKYLGVNVNVEFSDIAITECLQDAKVVRVHTQGDPTFANVGKSYPLGFEKF